MRVGAAMERPWFEPNSLKSWAGNTDATECTKGDLTTTPALVLQAVLGFLAFSVLVIKRFCEPPDVRRNWLVWFLDTSKQGLAMFLMHCINILLAEFGEKHEDADPCTYYLMSFVLDSSVGLIIIWMGLKLFELLIVKLNIVGGYKFGNYNVAPRYRSRSQLQSTLPSHTASDEEAIRQRTLTTDDDTASNVGEDGAFQESERRRPDSYQYRVVASQAVNGGDDGTLLSRGEREQGTLNDSMGATVCREERTAGLRRPRGIRLFRRTIQPRSNDRMLPFSLPIWLLQTLSYLTVTVICKIIVYHILMMDSLEGLYLDIRKLLTAWIPEKALEILFVLFVVPLILNCFMFWVVDNILMSSTGCLTMVAKIFLKLPQYIFDAFRQCCPCFRPTPSQDSTQSTPRPTPKNTTGRESGNGPGDSSSIVTATAPPRSETAPADTYAAEPANAPPPPYAVTQGNEVFQNSHAVPAEQQQLQEIDAHMASRCLSSSGVSGDLGSSLASIDSSMADLAGESEERATLVPSQATSNHTLTRDTISPIFNSKRVQRISASIDSACDNVRNVLLDMRTTSPTDPKDRLLTEGETNYTNEESFDDEALIIQPVPEPPIAS